MASTYPEWTDEEERILRTVYPVRGTSGTMDELRKIGSERSVGAVKMHAKAMGVRYDPRKRQHKEKPKPRRRYNSGNDRTLVNICLNNQLDADVIRVLRSKPNRSEYIRNLVRRDMGKL